VIVCVESNFVLEIAFLREEHEGCLEILGLAETQHIRLTLPAFSLGEPYEALVRRQKQRQELRNRLTAEIKELSRSKPYQEISRDFEELANLLTGSNEDEKRRLDESLNRIVNVAELIPTGASVIKTAIGYQRSSDLSPQDSIVYASIIERLSGAAGEPACFITKNSKDFDNLDIQNELANYNCKLLTTFKNGLGYIGSRP
jgi:predicted nucleic acid-binding protein